MAKVIVHVLTILAFVSYIDCADIYDRYYRSCYIRTDTGACCNPPTSWVSNKLTTENPCAFDPVSKKVICSADGIHNAQCLLNSQPDFGFAYPLGMMNGMIRSSDITHDDARLFKQGNGFASVNVAWNFKITFGAKKKITFIVFQDGKGIDQPSGAPLITLVRDNLVLSKIYECKQTFHKKGPQSCRILLEKPFRTKALKFSSNNILFSAKIEIGGMDYLEADHLWRMDTLLLHPKTPEQLIPDERGNTSLKSNLLTNNSSSATEILIKDLFMETTFQSASGSLTEGTCLSNLMSCSEGISFGFWFKWPVNGATIKSTTNEGLILLEIKLEQGKISVLAPKSSSTSTRTDFSVAGCGNCWMHYIIVWKKSDGSVQLYENRILKEPSSSDSSQPFQVAGKISLTQIKHFRNLQIWQFPLGSEEVGQIYEKGVASMDLKIAGFENFGDWKLATSLCPSGPCRDYAFSQKDGVVDVPLEYSGHVTDMAFYNSDDYTCSTLLSSSLALKENKIAMAAFKLDLSIVGVEIQRMIDARLTVTFSDSFSAVKGDQVEIYALNSYDYNDKYVKQCRFKFMDDDIRTGPLYWYPTAASPNLTSLIKPFMDRSTEIWRKQITIVLKFQPKQSLAAFSISDATFKLVYLDGTPEKFLFADLKDAPAVGYPLIYTTRYYVPTKKCLRFIYFMNGKGVGALAVTIEQINAVGSLFEEIFRLVGSQENEWQNASVPLRKLDSINQFRISFTASRGNSTNGSIAIDNIELGNTDCQYKPSFAETVRHNPGSISSAFELLKMEKPLILAPLTASTDNDVISSTTTVKKSASNIENKPTRDMFGYPLSCCYFKGIMADPPAGFIDIKSAVSPQLADFSIAFHVKPDSVYSTIFAWIKRSKYEMTVFSIEADGNFTISFISNLLKKESKTVMAQNIFASDAWVYLAITYSNTTGILTAYANTTKVLSHKIGVLNQPQKKVVVGSGNEAIMDFLGKPRYFKGYITCLQMYSYELEHHQIQAIKTCPDRISKKTCRTECKNDGACDSLTGKCICPSYSNRYLKELDCSSGLADTVYANSIIQMTFDSKRNLNKIIGKGVHFEHSARAHEFLLSGTSGFKFVTIPGPVNLAICTSSKEKIQFLDMSSCILTKTCPAGFSASFWVQPPPEKFRSGSELVILDVGAIKVSFGLQTCHGATKYSYKLKIHVGNEICTWYPIKKCSFSSQAWTRMTISVDNVKKRVLIVENGNMMKANKTDCTASPPTPSPSSGIQIGGSAALTCIDELVLWNQSLSSARAMKFHCALSHAGMHLHPVTINFKLVTFDEVRESLWALDMDGSVYYYDKGVWILVDKKMMHLSAGLNGVFGIGYDFKVYKRDGVTASARSGTAWILLTGAINWRKVESGYTNGQIYLIDSIHRPFCFKLSSSTYLHINNNDKRVFDISCDAKQCWAPTSSGKLMRFEIGANCNKVFKPDIGDMPVGSQLRTNRNVFLVRLKNSVIERVKFNYNLQATDTVDTTSASGIRHVSLLHSDIIWITDHGKLMVFKSEGQDAVTIQHSSGKSMAFSGVASKFQLAADFIDYFIKKDDICLLRLRSKQYLKPATGKLRLGDGNCNHRFKYFQDLILRRSTGDALLTAAQDKLNVQFSDWSSFFKLSGNTTELAQFYFREGSLKRIASFNPPRSLRDAADGAIKVQILVKFKLKDYTFLNNFRDKNGAEATVIYSKVKCEIDQIFSESPYYMTVKFDQINFHSNVHLWCLDFGSPPSDICHRPLYVQFTAMIMFGHISEAELTALMSKKFSGTETDCQGNECSFQLTGVTLGAFIGEPDVRNVTMSPNGTTSIIVKFQYFPAINSSAHIGYKINLKETSVLDTSWFTTHSRSTDEGTTFFMAFLPYHKITGQIAPLHLQDTAGQSAVFDFNTLETKPNAMPPSLGCSDAAGDRLKLTIKSIHFLNWNGNPLGYRVFYKKTDWSKVIDVYGGPYSLNDKSQFEIFNITVAQLASPSPKVIENLQVFTKYEIYVAAYNGMGLGPLAGIVCQTTEGVPEVFPKNISIKQTEQGKVYVTWKPLPNEPELWNSEGQNGYEYAIEWKEYTLPSGSSTIEPSITTTKVHYTMIDLKAGRGYKINVAAKTGYGTGVKSNTFCIRLWEDVPSATHNQLQAIPINETAVTITIGDLANIYDENGIIRYYNVTMTEPETGLKMYHKIMIDSIQSENILRTQHSKTDLNFAVNCSETYIENTPKTSRKKILKIANLTYYTQYSISSSACTSVGCGSIFQTSVRTNEYHPTCPPANAKIKILNSTSLVILWMPLEQSCTHGILTKYRLMFGEEKDYVESINRDVWTKFDESRYQKLFYYDQSSKGPTRLQLDNRKKFFRYCFRVAGFTAVGPGPYSKIFCDATLQDYPDGPPTNLTIIANTSRSISVKMCPPTPDKVNGIITKYTVFYSLEGENSTSELNVTANEGINNCTQVFVTGLKTFSFYHVNVAAWTKIGMGPKMVNTTVVRTFEDVPSTCLRNITTMRITEKDAIVWWYQVINSEMNGIFRGLRVRITEKLQDGVVSLARDVFINISRIMNSTTAPLNVTDYAEGSMMLNYLLGSNLLIANLIGLKAYALYNISLSACTTPGCGPECRSIFLTNETEPSGTVRNLKTSFLDARTILISWNPLPVEERHGLIIRYEIKWANLCQEMVLEGKSNNSNEECIASLSYPTKHTDTVLLAGNITSYVLADLVPLTNYTFAITAVTSKGYGPVYKWTVNNPENVPRIGPVINDVYNTSSTSIKLNWTEIPIYKRNGILIGHTLKYLESYNIHRKDALYKAVVLPLSSSGYYEYEIKGLERHTFYNILISGMTATGNGTAANVTVQTGPYVNGHWSAWSKWTFCTSSCGGGSQIRERTCTNPSPWNFGDDCAGSGKEVQSCNNHLCSGKFLAMPNKDCNVACSSLGLICVKDLELTSKSVRFQQLQAPSCAVVYDSWSTEMHSDMVENTGPCAGKGTWLKCFENGAGKTRRICNCYNKAEIGYGQWTPWSFCSKSCGGGIQTSTRACLLGEGKCSGESSFRKECNEQPCPVNGNWGQWSNFEKCNKTCGYGYRHRYRKCDNPLPSGGGRNCSGTSVDAEGGCNPQICPVDGGWSPFGPYGLCSQPCGLGLSERKRYCINPKPAYGGKYCQGESTDSKSCNPRPCSGLEVKCQMRLQMEWDFRYVYNHLSLALDLAETCRENLMSLYSNKSVVSAITFHNFYKGSVVANFSIYYIAVKNVEVLVLQDSIKSQGKVGNLTVLELLGTPVSALPSPPKDVMAVGISPISIGINWKFNFSDPSAKNLSSFYAFVRKQNSPTGAWEITGIPLSQLSFNLTDLHAVTTYIIRMSVSSTFASGPASNEVIATTLEGAPEKTVNGFELRATQPTEIYAEWETMSHVDYLGYPRGYIIRYKKYEDSVYKEIAVAYGSYSETIKGLKPFTLYIFEILAYTNVGRGPPVAKVVKTLEGVPDAAPPNVRVQQFVGTENLYVNWDAIDQEKTNGVFQGYKVKYTMLSVGGRLLVPKGKTIVIDTDKFTFDYEITRLQSYTVYEVTISGFTNAGEGPESKIIEAATCKCPPSIFLNWYETKPYVIKTSESEIAGIFHTILTETLNEACGTCNGKKSVISTFKSLSGENPEKNSELKVRASIGKEFHVSFPIFGKSEMKTFLERNAYVSLVQSSGTAVVSRNEVDYTAKTKAAFGAMLKVWPMYIVIITFTLVAGIIIWFFEHLSNPEFSHDDYLTGIFQGFWWAFVSATTVGYGDITPVTIPGRIFGIIWTLISLVLNGILIGSMTSSVTTMTLPPKLTLYGTRVSVIANSSEYSLAIRRNCKIDSGVTYENVGSILKAVKDKQADIALMDAFVAAAKGKKIKDDKLKVNEVIKTTNAFGFVLSHELVRLSEDFRSQISTRQDLVAEFVANMTRRLEVSEEQTTVVLLMDPSSSMFWNVLEFLGILAGSLTIAGIVASYYIKWRHYKKYVRINPDPRTTLSVSLDKDVDNFYKGTTSLAMKLEMKHLRKLEDLIWLKKNYARYLKRQAHYQEDADAMNPKEIPKPKI